MEELLCLNIGNSHFGLSCNILTFWLSFSSSRNVRQGMPRLCVQGSKDCVILIRAEQELVCLHIIMKQYRACRAEKAIPQNNSITYISWILCLWYCFGYLFLWVSFSKGLGCSVLTSGQTFSVLSERSLRVGLAIWLEISWLWVFSRDFLSSGFSLGQLDLLTAAFVSLLLELDQT